MELNECGGLVVQLGLCQDRVLTRLLLLHREAKFTEDTWNYFGGCVALTYHVRGSLSIRCNATVEC